MYKDALAPKGFLTIGGVVLVLLGILGFVGFSIGSALVFDNSENIAHLVLGLVALLLVFVLKNEMLNKWVTVLVGLLAIVAAVWGFAGISDSTLLGAQFENPIDNLLHLVVGAWGIYAGFIAKKAAA